VSDDAPRQAALPSMLIAMALSRSRPVNAALVNLAALIGTVMRCVCGAV